MNKTPKTPKLPVKTFTIDQLRNVRGGTGEVYERKTIGVTKWPN